MEKDSIYSKFASKFTKLHVYNKLEFVSYFPKNDRVSSIGLKFDGKHRNILIRKREYFFFQILVNARLKKAIFWITSKLSKGGSPWEQKCSSRSDASCASYKTILYTTYIHIEHDEHGSFCNNIGVLQRFYPAA